MYILKEESKVVQGNIILSFYNSSKFFLISFTYITFTYKILNELTISYKLLKYQNKINKILQKDSKYNKTSTNHYFYYLNVNFPTFLHLFMISFTLHNKIYFFNFKGFGRSFTQI